ncbi:MAG: asparaginase [Actinomycetes bacterium]|nr:asparaginase [Acidimicrobiia bacterium]
MPLADEILAQADRSGLTEEYHAGAIAVVDRHGRLVAKFGDVERPFFIRSSAKPFQAQVALEAGVDLPLVHLAVACSSHSGDPAHIALVLDILERHGLTEDDLQCPPARPFLAADRRLAADGDMEPARRYHNCSGKHAAFLAACAVAGYDTSTYRSADHPLQQRVASLLADVTGGEVGPPGVDGCGMPVWRVDAAGLARAFARLGNDDRFSRVREAMSRYPMLVSGEGRADGLIGRWTGGVAKAGAAGCMGVAYAGYGIGVKAWTGSGQVAAMGVTLALDRLGVVTRAIAAGLDEVISPRVLGGGEEVGRFRTVALLENQ